MLRRPRMTLSTSMVALSPSLLVAHMRRASSAQQGTHDIDTCGRVRRPAVGAGLLADILVDGGAADHDGHLPVPSRGALAHRGDRLPHALEAGGEQAREPEHVRARHNPVSYTHLRAHET